MKLAKCSVLLLTFAALIGCDRPAAKGPATPAPEKPAVDIQAPGVDVKVGGGDVEVKAPGVDVNTSPEAGTDVKVETAPPQ
jgi:hypothetical protein